MSRQFSCPEEALAGEIEFAIAYAVACDPGGTWPCKKYAEQIALMLLERAGKGLPGMAVEDMIAKPG